MRILRALPLLAAFTCPAALAEPSAADITRLLQNMQERLATLEARNAELEKRLADAGKAAALAARVEDVENELVALYRKPNPLERLEGISAGASLTMVGQDASGGGSQLTARYDVEVELPAGSIGAAEGKLFAHFRGGDGSGISAPSYASLNATAFGNNNPVLMQAWYQLDLPVGGASGNLGRLEATVGKIDPFGFFDQNNVADDESTGFLNLAFVHNPLLDAGGDVGVGTSGSSPGLRLAYVSDSNGGNHLAASVGVFATGDGANYTTTFHKPFSIAQVEYSGKTVAGLEGAYRLYTWNNAQAFDRVNDLDGNGQFDDTRERHRGWGLSFDQAVTDSATLFARYGHSSHGNLAFDQAYTVGGQLSGAAWGRPDDRLGLAFGWLKSSPEMQAVNPTFATERETELFYVWQANEHFHLSPSVQWIANPGGNPALSDVTVVGLRMKASY